MNGVTFLTSNYSMLIFWKESFHLNKWIEIRVSTEAYLILSNLLLTNIDVKAVLSPPYHVHTICFIKVQRPIIYLQSHEE